MSQLRQPPTTHANLLGLLLLIPTHQATHANPPGMLLLMLTHQATHAHPPGLSSSGRPAWPVFFRQCDFS